MNNENRYMDKDHLVLNPGEPLPPQPEPRFIGTLLSRCKGHAKKKNRQCCVMLSPRDREAGGGFCAAHKGRVTK